MACYEVEPLLPGYGVTIGHPLQHALLSLPGAAITAIRIEGIDGPLPAQDILGVDEDVTELMLNLKQIRLRCDADQPVILSLNAYGRGEVTAAKIVCPSSIEIVNPQAPIATLNHVQARLVMTLTVTHGKGYQPAPEPSLASSGSILLDATYTPVVRVSYRVERARVGNTVNYDKVVITVTTNGTLTPDEALCLAAQRLARSARALKGEYVQSSTQEMDMHTSGVPIPAQIYNKPLSTLGLPVRSFNSLKRCGCETVGHLLTMSEGDVRGIRNVGDKSLQEIVEALRVAGCFPSS